MKSQPKNNVVWVDVSKGLVICLMVLGHSGIPDWLSRWIWSFHMPFFFIISALFISWDKDPFFPFFVRKTKILLIPFVVYSIVNLAIYPYAMDVSHVDFAKTVLVDGWEGIALWFVPVFFSVMMLCKVTSPGLIIPMAFMSVVSAYLLCRYGVILPWTMSSVPFALFLMLICRKYKDTIRGWLKTFSTSAYKYLILQLTVCFAISLTISHFWRLDMAFNRVIPLVPILAGICAGIVFAVTMSILMSRLNKPLTRIFANIGRNTYEIMAVSQVTIATINHYLHLNAVLKYLLLIITLGILIRLRKFIEGRYSQSEPI